MSGGTGWLWIGVVAAAFLLAWRRERTYGLLAIGTILAGVALGVLLEGNLGWAGAFPVALGGGLLALDALEPREIRWARIVGLIVVLAGLILGIAEAGVLGSGWFVVLLVVAGAWLVARGADGDWVHLEPAAEDELP